MSVHDRSEQSQRACARPFLRVAHHVVGCDQAATRGFDRFTRELGAYGVRQRRVELGEHALDARDPATRVRILLGVHTGQVTAPRRLSLWKRSATLPR